MQFASDYGLIPFPTFLIKVQKTIWALITNNPVKATSTLMIADYFNHQNAVIYGSNVFTRNNIIQTPSLDWNIFLPVQ
jgi:hypothetical protein